MKLRQDVRVELGDSQPFMAFSWPFHGFFIPEVGWIELPRSMNVSDSNGLRESWGQGASGASDWLPQATTGWESMATTDSVPLLSGCQRDSKKCVFHSWIVSDVFGTLKTTGKP